MKSQSLSAPPVLVGSPIPLIASPETDRKIEDAATESPDYRTVRDDRAKVKARTAASPLSTRYRTTAPRSATSTEQTQNEFELESSNPDPMQPVASASHATGSFVHPGLGLYSDHMLSNLVAMHEEMIVQLQLERLEAVGTADYLTGLIDQHAKDASMLRILLEVHGAEIV